MSELEQRLREDRATRNAARAVHDANLLQVKQDLAARGIGGRIAAKAKNDALDLADEALAVAKESKGIIAGALGALALWFLRGHVAALAARLFKPAKVQESPDNAPAAEPEEEHDGE